MPGTETTRVATIGALFVLYLLIFIGFGPELVGHHGEASLAVASGVLAVLAARGSRGTVRIFYILLTVAFVSDLVNILTLSADTTVSASAWDDTVGKNEIPLSYVFYGLFLFFWGCAWGLRALLLLQRQRSTTVFVVSAVVLASIACLYAVQYHNYGMDVLDADQRFSTLFLALELAGLLLGLLCVLMGVSRAFLFMIVGFSLYAATDIVVTDMRLRELDARSVTLDPLWMLGRSLILAGMLILPRFRKRPESEDGPQVVFEGGAGGHSALSGVLLIFSLGAVVLAAVAAGLLGSTPHWLAMFYVLFSVLCVVILSVITAHFDETTAYTRDWFRRLFTRRLEAESWQEAPRRVRRMLAITELDSTLEAAREAGKTLSEDVIFLGPERLNRPGGRAVGSDGVTCFVMMPFGAEWSDAINSSIRGVCRARGVRPLRGDDIFTPTDILDDIWRGIVDSDFVIADITGRNTNVFYELGMAHAIGKPVLILSQTPDDVPIDLKTRRILMYDGEDLAALEAGLDRSIDELLDKYELEPRADEKSVP